MEVCQIIVPNLNGKFLLPKQPRQLHDFNFAGDPSVSRTDWSRGEPATYNSVWSRRPRTSDLQRSLISAALAWGEDVATDHGS
jgi:hypothetical protein